MKQSFFERLTGSINGNEHDTSPSLESADNEEARDENWMDEESGEGELAIDMHQTPDEIIINAMIAGVKPDDLDVSITRDMVSIKGKRMEEKSVEEDDYFYKELYWGSFSRTILLPQEVEPEEAVAKEKHGLLTIHLPKIDRKKSTKVKVKSS